MGDYRGMSGYWNEYGYRDLPFWGKHTRKQEFRMVLHPIVPFKQDFLQHGSKSNSLSRISPKMHHF